MVTVNLYQRKATHIVVLVCVIDIIDVISRCPHDDSQTEKVSLN